MRWNHVVAILVGAMLTVSVAGQQVPMTETRMGEMPVELSTAAIDSSPDLAPYTPAGWDGPVVVSSVAGTHSTTVPIPSGATAYLDFAAINQGTEATTVSYYHEIYVDDVLKGSWFTGPPHTPTYFVYVADHSLGVLADGLHEVRYVIDSSGVIAESNEINNVHTMYVAVGQTNLVPYQPVGWDDKIVLSTTTGTSTDAEWFGTSDTVYLDFSILNSGPGGVSVPFAIDLYVDGLYENSWSAPRMSPDSYVWAADYSLGQFAPGGHTVRLVIDRGNQVPETNEFDNEYIRTFEVSDSISPRIYISPTTLPFGSTGTNPAALAMTSQATNPADERGVPARFIDPQAAARRSALHTKAVKNGFVRVIVRLDAPFVPEGKLAAPGLEKQRRNIRERQARAIQALEVAEAHVKRFESIPFFAAELDANQFARLEHMPDVIDVVEDVAAAPQMASSNAVVRSAVAWAAGADGHRQVVAVLDTGIAATHPWFATGPNKVVAEGCYSSTTSISTSLCPGGVPASTQPESGMNCPATVNGCDHGTHVAGTVAGNDWTGPNYGVGREADLLAIQVFSRFASEADCGSGMAPCALSFVSDQIRGLERVLSLHGALPIAAVNMSLGFGHYTSRTVCDSEQSGLKAAIDNLVSVGIATVAATGNNSYLDATGAPACLSSVIAVSATSDTDQVASFANVASWISLVAPGVSITSSVLDGGLATKSGTSMAGPHVAGAWAIMKQLHPDWEIWQILNSLRDSAILTADTRDFALVKDLRRLDVGAAATGTAKGFQIRNFGGTALNVAPITAETPVAWVTWSPTGPILLQPGEAQQVRVNVNLAAAPVGLSVTRLLVTSNDPERTLYPDGVFIVVDRDPVPPPPANVLATAIDVSGVIVTWTAVTGAANYHVYRSSDGSSWTMVGASTDTVFVDTVVAANHAYLYKVRSYAMVESADSNRDLATTVAFTDSSIAGTRVRALHWTQLLVAVNAVRAVAGLPAVAFTAPAPAVGVSIRRQHLLDLRAGLNSARSALGLPALSYTDPTITAAVTAIRTAHVTDLRLGVR